MRLKFPGYSIILGKDSLNYLSEVKGKVLVVTTRSLMKSRLLSKVLSLVRADVTEGPRQHSPEEDLGVLEGKLRDYDVVVSLGGGSVIDPVKTLSKGTHIAIPTTLSGAEFTDIAGFTKGGFKVVTRAREPDMIILDPEATLETPMWLLMSTGVRALDHAIEALYSTNASLFTDQLAIAGFRLMMECLESLHGNPNDLDTRHRCQVGSLYSAIAMRYAGRGLSHAFGYVFGPRFNIPHGVTSCISLPIAIRFNYEVAKDKLKLIEGNEALHTTIEGLLRRIGLVYSLSQFANMEDALPLAERLRDYVNASSNPRKISLRDAEEFIREAYGTK